ncbi:RecQ family ATP-dependent DNA helicase, partial [Pseudomonadota bacterium]
WCLSGQTATATQRHNIEIDDALWQQAMALKADYPILNDVHTLTRFLCGVTSPQLSRAKLSKHPLCGALGHVPFQQLLNYNQAST